MDSADEPHMDRWRDKLREYQMRRERVRRLREELAIARAAGLAARHARRLAQQSSGKQQ